MTSLNIRRQLLCRLRPVLPLPAMSRGGAGLRPVCALIVLIAAGAGGAPLSCRQDTICLKDYKKEKFHRLNIVCGHQAVDLRENGDFFGRNISYDKAQRCVTWRDEILSDCTVTEIDNSGWRTELPITYICTADASTTPVPTSTTSVPAAPQSSLPDAEGYKRSRICAVAAAVPVLFLLVLLLNRRFFCRYQSIILHHSSSPENPKDLGTSSDL
ncbi:uncharacterized protein ACNLHF_028390 isoform 1-T1 [Anomaloglossus baeobatrachus]|uniref:uncharacterized protein LOC142250730 n=1 Tax=Anomaloglossus baeobatrachus TaxID=238106 RepID=UPI003F500CEC